MRRYRRVAPKGADTHTNQCYKVIVPNGTENIVLIIIGGLSVFSFHTLFAIYPVICRCISFHFNRYSTFYTYLLKHNHGCSTTCAG